MLTNDVKLLISSLFVRYVTTQSPWESVAGLTVTCRDTYWPRVTLQGVITAVQSRRMAFIDYSLYRRIIINSNNNWEVKYRV